MYDGRPAFGRATADGFFAKTRADDMAVKAVREVLRRNPQLPPGRVDDVVFDGRTETALFPGDLPADPKAFLAGDVAFARGHAADVRVLRFRPPRIILETSGGSQPALPPIRPPSCVQ